MRDLWAIIGGGIKGLINPAQRRPVVFFHIPKTAGTTTLQIFRRHYSPSFTSYDDHHRIPIEEAANVQFVSGHFSYDYCKQLLPGRFSFTFLRRPSDRLVSLYYHNRRMKSDKYEIFKIARMNSIENYLEICLSRDDLRGAIWNHQALTFAGGPHLIKHKRLSELDVDDLLARSKANLRSLCYIGLVDTYDDDLLAICDALSIASPRRIEKKNTTQNRPKVSDLSNTARELIADLVRLDDDLYDFAISERNEKKDTIDE